MCRCRLCKQSRVWEGILKKHKFNKRELWFFEDIRSELVQTGLDHDVLRAVMAGEWPSAVEQLEAALEKAKKKRQDGTSGA